MNDCNLNLTKKNILEASGKVLSLIAKEHKDQKVMRAGNWNYAKLEIYFFASVAALQPPHDEGVTW